MDSIYITNKIIQNITTWFLNYGVEIFFIIVITFFIYKLKKSIIEKIIRQTIVDKKHSKKEEEQRQNTLIQIFSIFSTILIWGIAFFIILGVIGVNIGPLVTSIAFLALAISLGTQHLVRDIINGFFIITENQYRIGDIVTLIGISGKVEDISLRATILRDLDGTVHHIPHGQITTVSNLSKHYAQVNLDIKVSYKSNLEEIIPIIDRVGQELFEDPLWRENIISPLRFLRVESFVDSAIILKVLGKTIPAQQWKVASEFRRRIKIAFDKNGIDPFSLNSNTPQKL